MDTSQLQCLIECDPVLRNRIIGTYAADILPRELPQPPFGFIANTDIHTKQGQHWLAFLVILQDKSTFLIVMVEVRLKTVAIFSYGYKNTLQFYAQMSFRY